MGEVSLSWISFEIGKSVGSLMKIQEIVVENTENKPDRLLLSDLLRRATTIKSDINNVIGILNQLIDNES